MDLIVNTIQSYKEVIVNTGTTNITSGLLDDTEATEEALKLMKAAWELLPYGMYEDNLREVIDLVEEHK